MVKIGKYSTHFQNWFDFFIRRPVLFIYILLKFLSFPNAVNSVNSLFDSELNKDQYYLLDSRIFISVTNFFLKKFKTTITFCCRDSRESFVTTLSVWPVLCKILLLSNRNLQCLLTKYVLIKNKIYLRPCFTIKTNTNLSFLSKNLQA